MIYACPDKVFINCTINKYKFYFKYRTRFTNSPYLYVVSSSLSVFPVKTDELRLAKTLNFNILRSIEKQ